MTRTTSYERGCDRLSRGKSPVHQDHVDRARGIALNLFRLVHQEARSRAIATCQTAPDGWIAKFMPPTRSLEQNAKLWPMLADIAKQVEWYGQHLTDLEWKDVFTASMKQQKVVPGLDGGFVVCGKSTSKMGKAEFSELIELMYAFGAQKGVVWTEGKVDLRRAA